MTALDHVVNISLTIVLIVGGYQFYFWCQRRTHHRTRQFARGFDESIPLWPSWTWIYSGLYYPVLIWTALSASTLRHFNYMAFSYLTLLCSQMILFLCMPVEVPRHWRSPSASPDLSRRFLGFVQRFDGRSNCFPSMHLSVASLSALHLNSNVDVPVVVLIGFVVLIGISCLLTKQHYVADLPPAVALGWANFELYSWYFS